MQSCGSKGQTTNAPLFGDMSILHEGTQIKDFVLVDLQNQLQNVDYTYNIRGWLKSINNPDYMGNDLFAFKINYNTTSMGAGNNPLYNGNISETIWKTANDVNTSNLTRGYAYNYDPLNRIVSANYGTKTSAAFNLTGDYDVWGIDYDKNGNIDHLKRKDQGLLMDDLIYTYDGNQLLSVKDDSTNIEGFKDGNTSGNDYTYDANGNMLSDANKGIADISYNHLNLPTKVTITGQGSIEYVYDATGVKMRKTISTGTVTDYANNFIYENGDLKFFSTPEGYVEPNSKSFDYIYQYKDHLGNVRLSYKDNNGTLEIIEENNYYPFGLKHKGYNNVVSANANSVAQKFKYNGKELEESLGYEMYEYEFRHYDAYIARFVTIDPLAEDYDFQSPYAYAVNDPVRFIDKLGLGPDDVIITGKAANEAFNQLQSSTSLKLEMDSKGNVKIIGGEAKTVDDRKLQDAITDNSVKINVIANDSYEAADGSGKIVPIETFGGNKDTGIKTKDGKSIIEAKQYVNTESTKKVDKYSNLPGKSIEHGVTEAHEGAKISQREGHKRVNGAPFKSSKSKSFEIYQRADDKATNQPARITVTKNKNGTLTWYANGFPVTTTPDYK